ncbi:hypothetical protein DCCM_2181 [Desulfocucumis palustris]|uniref:Uncharacterized protein n=1 Tax=Desulfocucumis palustris TaxID=1898651 RepID=A0A2L2XAT0_9FIRM|nr:hypothetical protein DCCM_2181 [Desulfocucumis palustris]
MPAPVLFIVSVLIMPDPPKFDKIFIFLYRIFDKINLYLICSKTVEQELFS